ncbi:DEAD/DEAH box helicase [Candidatus Parcubacteria bacterium]|nr:MAG: DEAD/DEAH box helicase [Candidatus Parcubacteria bacterium]
MRPDWADHLDNWQSKGSRAARPGSLAGLAAARREHMGQFFTPRRIAEAMWRLVEHVQAATGKQFVAVFDNSIGSGRLVRFAEPDRHLIFGCDVDADLVAELSAAARDAGFIGRIAAFGMEDARPRHMDVALINPPFSVHLETPTLFPYPCTHFGRFGPSTSATSHEYALHQACDAAPVVAAILPATYADTLPDDEHLSARLRALVELPSGSFMEEGTAVSVKIAVFGSERGEGVEVLRLTFDEFQRTDFDWLDFEPAWGSPVLNSVHHEPGTPKITRPVTGDRKVRITHNGRRIRLKFGCGYAEAVVMNRLLRERVDVGRSPIEPRLPRGIRYEGQGILDMEAWLASGDPSGCLARMVATIEAAGFEPEVDAAFRNWMEKRIRRHEVERAPFGRWVFGASNGQGESARKLVAKKTWLADPLSLEAPAVMRGDSVEVIKEGGRYYVEEAGRKWEIPAHELHDCFDLREAEQGAEDWVEIEKPLQFRFPDLARHVEARARRAGVDRILTWTDYQFADLVEVLMKRAAIVSWDTGLGKARLACSLILASECRRGLIVVEAGLLDEMRAELGKLPLADEAWQVIETPEQARNLRRVNVISYTRLRMPLERGTRRTYAKAMRRRFGIVVADEADILCNPNSQQSRAVAQLAPKRRYALSATPSRNYPRDMHPLTVWTHGDGTAIQPYGWRRGYMDARIAYSTRQMERGIDRFREQFIVTEWVTNEFAEENREGAKREVPKIADVVGYREWLAPLVKRRLVGEPDVARYVRIPDSEDEVMEVDWDLEHLAFYLRVADEFAEFYRRMHDGGKNIGLAMLLARINAVCLAASCPQMAPGGFAWRGGLTSKQKRAVDDLERLANEGHKTVFYARNVQTLEIMDSQLRARGVDAVLYHGGIPREKRTLELNRRFRYGDAPVLLASLGITQKGLNLWQADRTYFFDRSWDSRTEYQAKKRIERPQQTRTPRHLKLHLPGSVDEYQAQMVAMKADAIQAGLDWGDPRLADQEFVHLDTILGRFVDELARLHGYFDGHEFRESLRKAA